MTQMPNRALFIVILCVMHLLRNAATACAQSCLSCSSSLVCLQCASNTYIAVASTPTKGCLPCRPGCKTCSSQYSACMSCSAGYYMNSTASKCLQCMVSFCDTCDEMAPEICTACSNGYYLIEASGTCEACSLYPYAATCRQSMILSCQLGYYVSGGQKCLSCGSNCLKCTSPTFCSLCKDGYYGSTCTACHSSCQTCIRSTACLTCKSGLYLSGSLCTSCPISSNPACIACDSTGKCAKCPFNYYLDETKMCVPLNAKIVGCIRYETNPNTLVVQCKQCQSGFYLSASGTSCLHCSLLCSNCSGMYSTSSCTSCRQSMATQLSPGVCSYSLSSFTNFQQNSYLSEWNYPANYSYLGTTTTVVNDNCPSWKLSTRTRVKFGIINGYNISYRIKMTLSVNDTAMLASYNYNLSVNGIPLVQANLGSDPANLPSQCSSAANRSTTEFTHIINGSLGVNFVITKLAPANTLLPGNANYFELQSVSSGLSMTISQLLLTYHVCHDSCALCQSDTECVLCKDTSLLIQGQHCVDHCDQFYYLYGQKCLKNCPVGTFANPYADVWSCTPCPAECTRCGSLSSCLSCSVSYFLKGEACVKACPDQYFANSISSRCQPCSPPCLTCTSAKSCFSCSYNFLYNSTCLASSDCPVGFFPQLSSMSCVKCSPPCKTCLSNTSCKSCEDGSGFFYKGKCLRDCPTGFIKNTTTLTCDQCSPLCLSCWNTTDFCLKCRNGFLLDGHCLAGCPNGLFENYTSMECSLCQPPCLTCRKNPYTCKLCATGFIFHDQLSKCLLETECLSFNGSFLNVKYVMGPSNTNSSVMVNKTVKSCTKCPGQCATCSSAFECQSCQPSFYLLGSKCIISCPYGYYSNNRELKCSLCSFNCSTCLSELTFCTSCPPNTRLNYLAVCSSGCLNKDELEPTCEKCKSPCYECRNLTTMCQSCLPGYYLHSATWECLERCYDGYFADRALKRCMKCNQSCLTCTNSSSQCTSCPGSTYLVLIDGYFQSGDCVKNCPSRFYPQILSMVSQMCQACQEPCLECEEISSRCLSCLAGSLNGNECVPECPADKYLDNGTQSCQPCSPKCLSCFGPLESQCYACRQGYYYLELSTMCLSSCPPTFKASIASSKCQPCEFPCLQCSNSTSTCTKCWQNGQANLTLYFLNAGECLNRCPSATYSFNGVCQSCQSPCKECLSSSFCLTCLSGYFFLLNACYSTCPTGFFSDSPSQSCIKCEYPCKSCLSQTECLTCIDGIRLGNSCSMIDQCPIGQYLQYSETNGICKQCNLECKQCADRADRCLSCMDTKLVLFNSQCLQNCPSGFYKVSSVGLDGNSNSCSTCPIECAECQNETNCTACEMGLNYLSGKCIEQCPPTHYRFGNGLTGTCQLCSSTCKTCVNSQTNCLSCQPGYFWYQFSCLSSCQQGTYKELFDSNSNQGVCRECVFPCRQCLDSQTCLHCLSGFFLHEGSCIENCKKPLTAYYEGNDAFCSPACPSSYPFVLDLGTTFRCSLTCSYPFLLSWDKLSCLVQCPSGMYVNEKLQCQTKDDSIGDLLPMASIQSYVDSQYRLNMIVLFNKAIKMEDFEQNIKDKIEIRLHENLLYNQSQQARLLSALEPTSNVVQYRVLKIESTYMTIEMNPATLSSSSSPSQPGYLTLEFQGNSNLLIKSSVSSIPVQSSLYTAVLPPYESYSSQFEVSPYFSIFGQVLVVFLLIIAFILLVFNWYAKIYESLHFCQLVFLLAVLEIQFPPNLWLFLQGFKNAHFYFIKNWFISDGYLNRISESSPKVSALLVDSNFIRIFGHVFCLLFIALFVALILFLARFLTSTPYELVNRVGTKMYGKFKLIKWSHIHDFVTTITMILVFSFTAQMYDYKGNSIIQIFGIVFSYVSMAIVICYYCFMAYKLHHIVKMSQEDPRRFCQKKYLFRNNMLSITESAVHPKELYLNYLRAIRIIVFGAVIGLFNTSPMLCIGCLMTILLVSSLVYMLSRPYPDHLQNILLSLADVSSTIALLFICLIHFQTADENQRESKDQYLRTKWRLGWVAMIFVLVTAFLLLAELLVSIVKGNSSPLKLSAEDPKELPSLLNTAPKNIEVSPKKHFIGWQVNEDDKVGSFAYKYEAKTE